MEVPRLENCTLANLAEGALEAQFQEALQRLGEDIISDLNLWECDAQGAVSAKIKMEASFSIASGDGAAPAIIVAVRAELAGPKRKMAARSLHWQKRDNQFVVWANEPQQAPLFDSTTTKVTPIEGRK